MRFTFWSLVGLTLLRWIDAGALHSFLDNREALIPSYAETKAERVLFREEIAKLEA